jgi:hypothetical protein
MMQLYVFLLMELMSVLTYRYIKVHYYMFKGFENPHLPVTPLFLHDFPLANGGDRVNDSPSI